MYKTFIKESEVGTFKVYNNKVLTTITLNDKRITNPTLDQFLSTGWVEYTEPDPEIYIPTIEELVELKIREKYSINLEFEVQRKRETEPEEFLKYYNFIEECITWAYELPHREK